MSHGCRPGRDSLTPVLGEILALGRTPYVWVPSLLRFQALAIFLKLWVPGEDPRCGEREKCNYYYYYYYYYYYDRSFSPMKMHRENNTMHSMFLSDNHLIISEHIVLNHPSLHLC